MRIDAPFSARGVHQTRPSAPLLGHSHQCQSYMHLPPGCLPLPCFVLLGSAQYIFLHKNAWFSTMHFFRGLASPTHGMCAGHMPHRNLSPMVAHPLRAAAGSLTAVDEVIVASGAPSVLGIPPGPGQASAHCALHHFASPPLLHHHHHFAPPLVMHRQPVTCA